VNLPRFATLSSLMSSERMFVERRPFSVGEQLRRPAAAASERANQRCPGRIVDRLHPSHAAFCGVVERDLSVLEGDVLLADRGQPKTAIVIGVLYLLLAADSE
jgi:hypothetical protein